MNKYKVEVLPLAWNDLREIGEYIAQNDPAAANLVVEKLIASLRRLETFPLSAPLAPDTELSKEGYRVLVCGKHLCFYRVEDKTVFVCHVAHSAMSYPTLLRSLSSKKTEE